MDQRDQETRLPNLEYLAEYMKRIPIPEGKSAALALIQVQEIKTPTIPTMVNIARALSDYRRKKGNRCTKVARVDGRNCFAIVYSGIKDNEDLEQRTEELEQSVEAMRFDSSGNHVPEGAYSVDVKSVSGLYDMTQRVPKYIRSAIDRLDQA